MRVCLLPILSLALVSGCATQQGACRTEPASDIFDLTNTKSTCEVHGLAMTPKLVDTEWGWKQVRDVDIARAKLFPHADEPFDTGFCIPPREHHARVFVCSQCSEVRASWLAANRKAEK
jgi:hypothetical protein